MISFHNLILPLLLNTPLKGGEKHLIEIIVYCLVYSCCYIVFVYIVKIDMYDVYIFESIIILRLLAETIEQQLSSHYHHYTSRCSSP